MNELVFMKNDEVLTNSRNVARDFNKEHHNVVKAIEGIVKSNDTSNLFHETTYVHEQNKQKYKEYLMNRDGFTLLAMSFTGNKAMEFKLKYISEFNKMENFLNSPEMIVQRAMEIQNRKVQLLETENAELKPKATYHDLVLQSNTLLTTTQVAKDLGIGAPTLNKKLHELGIQYKKGHRWYLYHKYQDKGYAQSKTYAVSADESKDHMYWTQKGKQFIFDLLEEKEGILPVTKIKE